MNILKLIFLCATIITLTGFQVLAKDSKDKKIEQLETLLQLYIEENLALKNEIKVLKSSPNFKIESDTSQLETLSCEQNPLECNRTELCELATSQVIGAQRMWNSGSFKKFVDEAKRRNLNCRVTQFETTKGFIIEEEINQIWPDASECTSAEGCPIEKDDGIKTARSLCEENLTGCDDTLLCKMSTHMSKYYENGKLIDNRAWFKSPEHRKFIDEAKRRNLSCGVADLEAKAERDRQEAEKEAKLKAEAEAEKNRKAEKEAKLKAEAEAEKIRNAEKEAINETGKYERYCDKMKTSDMNLQACSGFVIGYAKGTNINYYNLFSMIYQQDRDKISKIDIECSQNKTLNSFDDGMKYTLTQVNKMLTGKHKEFNEQYSLCVDVFGDIVDGK